MDGQEQPQEPKSIIQIVFKEPGSVIYDIRATGIYPGQFLALAEIMRIMGEAGFVQEQARREQEAERQRHKIIVPNAPDINAMDIM